MYTENKKNYLLQFVDELKENGFTVYAPENITTYCHFVKDDKIGYVEYGNIGFNFSTVHKPCREWGTGFSITRDNIFPTIELAEKCFIIAPSWFSSAIPNIKKYKNWNEYQTLNNWCNRIEL